jgi:hypothetical protein
METFSIYINEETLKAIKSTKGSVRIVVQHCDVRGNQVISVIENEKKVCQVGNVWNKI